LIDPVWFNAISGQGMRAEVDPVLVGNHRLKAVRGLPLNGLESVVASLQSKARTAVLVALDG